MTSREFIYKNKNVFTFVSIRKIGIATKRLYSFVYYPHFFNHKYRGQIMGGLVQPTKVLDHFSECDFSPKKTFPRRIFSSLNVNEENPVKILPT